MKKLKKVCATILATGLLATALVGCGTSAQATNQPIVAVIDDVQITESLYRTYLWSAQQILEQWLGPEIWSIDLDGRSTEEWAKDNALESITLSIETEKKAKELNLSLTKDEQKECKENAAQFKELNPDILTTYGFTEADVEEVLLSAELSRKVQEKLMENYEPAEADIQAFIEENRSEYATVTAKHVLITTTDDYGLALSDEEITEKKALADDILQRALAGEDMATLAAEYSEDPGSASTGGEYTFARGQMVQEFEDASFDGIDGEVWPELVETSYGYHIIKTESHNEADETEIRDDFVYSEKVTYMNTVITEMIENAVVEKTDVYDTIRIIKQTDETEEESTGETADETTETEGTANE